MKVWLTREELFLIDKWYPESALSELAYGITQFEHIKNGDVELTTRQCVEIYNALPDVTKRSISLEETETMRMLRARLHRCIMREYDDPNRVN
jgi:hypothetical protein